MKQIRFDELNLSKELLKAVNDMGFEEATPIQAQAIPHILKGKDVIGNAQTGTGKTTAFGLPILEMVDPNNKVPQAIILCPTRELAIQVVRNKDFIKIQARHTHFAYLRRPTYRKTDSFIKKGVQIIIGTPGRVMDHMRRHTLKLQNVKIVVLDEADEMLDMGFREDIEKY